MISKWRHELRRERRPRPENRMMCRINADKLELNDRVCAFCVAFRRRLGSMFRVGRIALLGSGWCRRRRVALLAVGGGDRHALGHPEMRADWDLYKIQGQGKEDRRG